MGERITFENSGFLFSTTKIYERWEETNLSLIECHNCQTQVFFPLVVIYTGKKFKIFILILNYAFFIFNIILFFMYALILIKIFSQF